MIHRHMSKANTGDLLPTPAPSHIYDRLAHGYDGALKPCERLFLSRWRAEAFANLGELAAGGRLLEIGAGTGANFVHYTAEARGVAGEISRGMIERARLKPHPARIHLVQHQAEKLPFADATFDCALATLVFCSVQSPLAAFRELRRVVRAGGRISLLEHVRPENTLLGFAFDALNRITVPLLDDHFNRRTASIAAEAGLNVMRVERRACGIVQFIVCEVK